MQIGSIFCQTLHARWMPPSFNSQFVRQVLHIFGPQAQLSCRGYYTVYTGAVLLLMLKLYFVPKISGMSGAFSCIAAIAKFKSILSQLEFLRVFKCLCDTLTLVIFYCTISEACRENCMKRFGGWAQGRYFWPRSRFQSQQKLVHTDPLYLSRISLMPSLSLCIRMCFALKTVLSDQH